MKNAPPVYQPCPSREVLQSRMKNPSAAPPVYNPWRNEGVQAKKPLQSTAPPVYRPAPPEILQPFLSSSTVQMTCPLCHKKKGHKSGCERNSKVKKSKAKEKKKEHVKLDSWQVLNKYRPGWVRDNNIPQDRVTEYVKDTGNKIKAHGSGDSTSAENPNTTNELNWFKSWYTTKYEWV